MEVLSALGFAPSGLTLSAFLLAMLALIFTGKLVPSRTMDRVQQEADARVAAAERSAEERIAASERAATERATAAAQEAERRVVDAQQRIMELREERDDYRAAWTVEREAGAMSREQVTRLGEQSETVLAILHGLQEVVQRRAEEDARGLPQMQTAAAAVSDGPTS